MDEPILIYTIGHSNHTLEDFVALLRSHGIQEIVDVRSQPYSQWATQFNRELLRHDLLEAGLAYDFMGDVIGGRPQDSSVYDAGQERPNYQRMAETEVYRQGIATLLSRAEKQRVAIMCSEGPPQHCHRHLLITQSLLEVGARVTHILADGTTLKGVIEPQQLSLFG
jgi:uncharacterized protein (DUF488 family)